MLEKKAIRLVTPREDQFISSIFTRPKKEGSLRTIINLKRLNLLPPYVHFKMETLNHMKSLLRSNDYMVT